MPDKVLAGIGDKPMIQLVLEQCAKASGPAAVVNTAEEAVAIRQLLDASKNSEVHSLRILLVTSAFHMRRAQRLFERKGLVVEPFPVGIFRPAALGPVTCGLTQPSGFILRRL